MARVTLIGEEQHPQLAALVERIRGARRGRLLNIYRLLLHSPPLAEAWLDFNSAVRFATDLDGQTRELAVMRVAILNRVDYIVQAHASFHAPHEGLTPALIGALADWQGCPLFTAAQRALLGYVDAMTRDIDVADDVFEPLRAHYSERQIVELTVLVGAYNMHTRVLKALDIDPESAAQDRPA
ncbi:MAG TPA: carboxymuconolactone decarboxylase family protein [Burkholderiales bacterium]|jgi:alkylhydroperoxidase family enzyme|nr:carboxymuconolactone decarboxylase family protein [Burkholderiales bacterium]